MHRPDADELAELEFVAGFSVPETYGKHSGIV